LGIKFYLEHVGLCTQDRNHFWSAGAVSSSPEKEVFIGGYKGFCVFLWDWRMMKSFICDVGDF